MRPPSPVASVPRAAMRGVVLGGLVFAGGLAMHGEVRELRGCAIDTPGYEIVNGPAMLLAAVGLPIVPERPGEAPPLGWTPLPGPTFDRTVLLTAGLLGWAGLGAAVGALVVLAVRRRR